MKKRIVIAGALLFVLAAVAVPGFSETGEKKMSKKATKLMAKVSKAIQEKQTDQAIELLRQVIVLEPENATVRHNMGVVLHQKGQIDESIASFEEALRLDPDYQRSQAALRQTLFDVGKNASGKGDFEKANSYLLKLEALPVVQGEDKGLRATNNYLIGYNYFNLKQNDKAVEQFGKCQAAENLEKDNRELYANATYFLGMLGHIQGAYEKSNDHFRKYLALYAADAAKPGFYSHANFFVGTNLFRLLEAKMAAAKNEATGVTEATAEIMPYIERAIADKIPSEDAHVMLGNCYVYRKDYDKAEQVYQQLIAAFPQSTQLQSYQSFLEKLKEIRKQEEKGKKKR